MALATLSVDLVAHLAKFEGDMGKAARAGQTPVRRRSPPIVSASLIYRFEGIPKPIMQPVNTTPHPLGGSRNDLR